MRKATSRDLSKALERHVHPVLSRLEFSVIKTRYACRPLEGCNWLFFVNAVGAHFSLQTGFPSLSFGAMAGICLRSLPNPWSDDMPFDKEGHPQWMDVEIELTSDSIDSQPRRGLDAANQARKDVWWVEQDGSNFDDACADLARAIETQAGDWFSRWGSAEGALVASLDEERDYPGRTWRIYGLASMLGREDVMEAFRPKLEMHWRHHAHKLIRG